MAYSHVLKHSPRWSEYSYGDL